jgi:hypothetical protein
MANDKRGVGEGREASGEGEGGCSTSSDQSYLDRAAISSCSISSPGRLRTFTRPAWFRGCSTTSTAVGRGPGDTTGSHPQPANMEQLSAVLSRAIPFRLGVSYDGPLATRTGPIRASASSPASHIDATIRSEVARLVVRSADMGAVGTMSRFSAPAASWIGLRALRTMAATCASAVQDADDTSAVFWNGARALRID